MPRLFVKSLYSSMTLSMSLALLNNLAPQAYQCEGGPICPSKHVKVPKYFAYISYGCGIHSTGGLSLNHAITSSLGLRSTPKPPKSTPDLHWHNTLRVDPYDHPQHSNVLKHFAYICNDCEMQSKGVWRAD
jgi:hypothetical protein